MFIPLRDDNPTTRVPVITIALIAVNTAVFLFQASLPHGLEQAALRFGAVPYAITHFRALAGTASFPPLLTLLTSMFLHGSLLHLLGNMLYLWIFGNNVEDVLGPVRFSLFYIACGVTASLTHVLFVPGSRVPMIGYRGHPRRARPGPVVPPPGPQRRHGRRRGLVRPCRRVPGRLPADLAGGGTWGPASRLAKKLTISLFFSILGRLSISRLRLEADEDVYSQKG
jgi:hypothetical protein